MSELTPADVLAQAASRLDHHPPMVTGELWRLLAVVLRIEADVYEAVALAGQRLMASWEHPTHEDPVVELARLILGVSIPPRPTALSGDVR